MSLDDKEIKKRLSKADEDVTEKISEIGGDAEAIKRGVDWKKETTTGQEEEQEIEEVEDIDIDNEEIDENTPNPT
jgi:hypothetical protein